MLRCLAGIQIIVTALLAGLKVCAQHEQEDSLCRQFVRYQEQALQEKVFAHIDKTFYMAGETIWFKVYAMDASFHRPSLHTGFVYVELIGNDHRPVLRGKVRLKDGSGDGEFLLPASIATGNYWLRAYTSWMKNFGPEYYFHQQVSIVNSISAVPAGASLVTNRYKIGFFPEGGHLVEGLLSRVAFRVTGPDGKGVDCVGALIGQRNDTIGRFASIRFGMGSFMTTPVRGERYRAIIRTRDTVITAALPAGDQNGYVIHLQEDNADRIRMVVRSAGVQDGERVYLFTQSRQVVKKVQTAVLSNGEAVFVVDKKELGNGVSQLTLFNSERMPVCERLYFKRPAATMRIGVTGVGQEYKKRARVDIGLETSDPGSLSMSVFRLDPLQDVPQENILNYLMLTSDLPGRVESPQYYFDSTGRAADETVDLLLLTQGWTRFRWDDILKNKTPYFEFLPEMGGSVIQGKVVDKRTGQPVPSVMAYLSIPGTRFGFSTAVSRKDGRIFFDIDEPVGSHELIVQTNSRQDSNCRVEMVDPFSERYVSDGDWKLAGLRLDEREKDILAERHLDVQVENAYRTRAKHRWLPDPLPDTLAFYGKPDLKYRLEDYTRFTTLEEVMHEYIQDVRLRRQSGDYYFRVRDAPFDHFFDLDPLLLLDGVPVFDANKLVAIDPLKLAQIDVMNRKFYTGSLVNEGIISLRSNEGDLAGYSLDPSAVVVEYEGVQQRREFYEPPYAGRAVPDRLPDARGPLRWSPDIKMGAGGKQMLSFYTSDRPGRYAVVVQGLSANGRPGYSVVTFEVK